MFRSFSVLLLALFLCAFLNFVGVRGYVLLDHYSGFADHFNTVGVVFLLFWVALLGLLLRRWLPLSPLPSP